MAAGGIAAAQLAEQARNGRSVTVPCRQGIGRSAVLAAAVLIATGIDAEDALRRVAEARGRPVPETAEQPA